MSSLRLAMQLSLREQENQSSPTSGDAEGVAAPAEGALPGLAPPDAAVVSAAAVTSPFAAPEEHPESALRKKRGPGRPRKYPKNDPDGRPRKRGRPRKHAEDGDDAFSSENEFSIGDSLQTESENIEDEMTSAASTIQSHWKKKKGIPQEVAAPATPLKMAATRRAEEVIPPEATAAPGPPPPSSPTTQATKPVAPPDSSVVKWMRYIPIKRARKAVVAGLRVKVRFASDNKVRKDGKLVRKRVWYGGRISAVSKEGSKSKCLQCNEEGLCMLLLRLVVMDWELTHVLAIFTSQNKIR